MNYVLSSDFATLQRLLSDGFNNLNNAVTTVNEGLCNGFYQEARLVDGVNQNIMNGNFALTQFKIVFVHLQEILLIVKMLAQELF